MMYVACVCVCVSILGRVITTKISQAGFHHRDRCFYVRGVLAMEECCAKLWWRGGMIMRDSALFILVCPIGCLYVLSVNVCVCVCMCVGSATIFCMSHAFFTHGLMPSLATQVCTVSSWSFELHRVVEWSYVWFRAVCRRDHYSSWAIALWLLRQAC